MKLTAALLSAAGALASTEYADVVYQRAFQQYIQDYQKDYAEEDLGQRLAAFTANYDFVQKHNAEYQAGKHSYYVHMGPLADLTNEEYRARNNRRTKPSRSAAKATFVPKGAAPDSWDWRTTGHVTPVKNQGQCGSCWAFSAVASMEGAYNLKQNNTGSDLVQFSEQEVVDCTLGGADTCTIGGEMHDGIMEIVTNHKGKINKEADYPYTGQSKGKCEAKDATAVDAGITGYTNVTHGDEDALKAAAYEHNVISVAIDASHPGFQLYFGGVYNSPLCKSDSDSLDHGVAVVGYGTLSGKDYWIVKNSWGAVWGKAGYILMSRGKNNQCGIATDACFATV